MSVVEVGNGFTMMTLFDSLDIPFTKQSLFFLFLGN